MAKDYWGNGTGSLTPRDAGETPPAPRSEMPGARPVARAKADISQPTALGEVKERPVADAAFDTPSRFGKLSMPKIVASISNARKLWFGVSFLAPVVISAFYLFLIAPDEYVTEYRFSVRVPVGSQVSPGASAGSFAAVFGGNPNPTTDMLDNYTVADYVTSTQAARDLDAKVSLRSMFNKPSDPFSKLGEKPTAERLGKYWRKMVYSNFDPATGLAIVRVHAYSAADSYAIATNLVNLSSDVVNSIGAHSQQDSVRFAQQQLDRANAQVTTLRGQLAELRRQSNVIDPDKGAISGNIDLINQLSNRRAMLQSQLELSQHQLNNAQAPQVLLLKEQIAAVNSQIAQARQSGGSTSGQPNMAVTVGRFEETESKLKNAVIVQASAAQALSTVQTNADAQRLYLTTYVRPAQPESPQAPQRWLAMLQITLAAAMIWVIGRMIGNSIMEHE